MTELREAETERVRRIWERTAPRYDKMMGFWDRILFEGGREWVCEQAEGKVLEIAVGTGRNLELYPRGANITGIDISETMLEIGRRHAADLGREVDLRIGDAQALEFEDESFDTVVCTLSLCSIPDARLSVAEMKRVLRPGGRLLLLDHVRSPSRIVYAVQRALELITLRLAGDHLTRRPLEHLRSEGFEITKLERSKWGIVQRVAARKPA